MNFEMRFHRELAAELAAAVAEEQARLGRGVAADHADYRHRCGQIKGLEMAATIAAEVAKSIFGDDEQETR